MPMLGGQGGLGPAWTRGEIERPAGTKNMGGWTAAVYTTEQQRRLRVTERGDPVGGGGSGGGLWEGETNRRRCRRRDPPRMTVRSTYGSVPTELLLAVAAIGPSRAPHRRGHRPN
eukprot:SAG11_NODE_11453_length_759_cov_3.169697_1_plen_115_part_00